MAEIKVLVVDDHDLVRMGIRHMLDDHPDMHVIGDASDGEMALDMVRELAPDVVLLDVNMPNIGGVEVTKRLRQHNNAVKIIAIVACPLSPIPMLLKAGVNGYITKGTPFDEMVKAIKKVVQGADILAVMWLRNLQTC